VVVESFMKCTAPSALIGKKEREVLRELAGHQASWPEVVGTFLRGLQTFLHIVVVAYNNSTESGKVLTKDGLALLKEFFLGLTSIETNPRCRKNEVSSS